MNSLDRAFIIGRMGAAAEPSLRQLRAACLIADHGSLTAAASAMNRTQPAITKSLRDLEEQLGVALFDRFAHGMEATPHGKLLIARIREAEAQFEAAGRAYAQWRREPSPSRNAVFDMQVSRSRLAAFLAVHEARDVTRAAERLGTTRAAIYDSLRTLESLLDLPLFESTASGMRSTGFADLLAMHMTLAFTLIRHGIDEVLSLDGATRGQLVIGTLPYSRTTLVPRAIHRVLRAHPQLRIRTREGPYDVLEQALRSGLVDLIVGATRSHPAGAPIRSEPLFEDELAVICSARHPLAERTSVDLAEVLDFGWVLPVREAPARQLFDRLLAMHGMREPAQVVETGSSSAARGLLLESTRLALLSTQQVQLDLEAGLLRVLPLRLEGTYRPIGITLRAHTTPSPAARVFVDALHETCAEHRGTGASAAGSGVP